LASIVSAAIRKVQFEDRGYSTHIKVSASNTDHGHAIYSNLQQNSNIKTAEATYGPTAIPIDIVEEAKALFSGNSRQHEAVLVSLYTPFLMQIVSDVNPNLRLVNSEQYKWIHCMSGHTSSNLKPDLFSAHHALIQFLPPFSNAPECSVPRLFGKFLNWELRSSVHCIWDAKWKIDMGGFGEKCKYLQITGEDSVNYDGFTLKLKGVLFDVNEFWMIRSTGNSIFDVVKCEWSQTGSKKYLSDFLTSIDPWLEAVNALCLKFQDAIKDVSSPHTTEAAGPSCLGCGANGRTFKLQSGRVLKVVVGRKSDNVEKEYKLMLSVATEELTAAEVFPVIPDSFHTGFVCENTAFSGYLLSEEGVKLELPLKKSLIRTIFQSLHVLHSNNVIHGDPRIENVLLLNDVVKWIDFRECELVTAKISLRRDVSILHESLGGAISGNANEKIELYMNDPTIENLFLVADLL